MKINKHRTLTLSEWMSKHQVSTYHTNINLAIAQAINGQDRKELAKVSCLNYELK